jgi:hypothetical protein
MWKCGSCVAGAEGAFGTNGSGAGTWGCAAAANRWRRCCPLRPPALCACRYALTGKEVKSILMQRLVKVDGKVRERRRPARQRADT